MDTDLTIGLAEEKRIATLLREKMAATQETFE